MGKGRGVGTLGATPDDVRQVFAACPEGGMPSSFRSLLVNGPDVSLLRDTAGSCW